MQGVQKLMTTGEACRRAVRAGADFLLIGNNMMDEQQQAARYARDLRAACETDAMTRIHAEESIDRIRGLKP
jgi:beta-N-acetylhexosaminidase